ncbi:NAD(P)H-dependent oxidoreductase [Streptomyces sp. NPDC002132]|uniref:NADPH-dependent FMN reductase n=1 Tax=unclassified Streptomyces TaxID=2593676 RepID=UPI00331B32CD
MIRIAVIIGSTRPGRRVEAVARWVADTSVRHPAVVAGQADVEVVDIAAYALPLLDEPVPAAFTRYANAHTRRWAETIAAFDGFVFVTPEYNRSVPAALKNAIDFLYAEWHHKAAGFVVYGVHGGIRAVEQLRQVMAEVKIADVQTQVALAMFTDFTFTDPTDPTDPGTCTPSTRQEATLATMLDEIIAWSQALKPLRDPSTAPEPLPARPGHRAARSLVSRREPTAWTGPLHRRRAGTRLAEISSSASPRPAVERCPCPLPPHARQLWPPASGTG